MKCPGCNFVCSELRDICPKCVCDLRPFKRSNGLPVTNAAMPYDDLLKKARPKKAAQKAIPLTASNGGVAQKPKEDGTGSLSTVFSSLGLSSLTLFFKRSPLSTSSTHEDVVNIPIQKLPEHNSSTDTQVLTPGLIAGEKNEVLEEVSVTVPVLHLSEPIILEPLPDAETTQTDLTSHTDVPLLLAEPTETAVIEATLLPPETAQEAIDETPTHPSAEEIQESFASVAAGAPIEKILAELQFSSAELPEVFAATSEPINTGSELEILNPPLTPEATVFLLTNDNFPSLSFSTGPSLSWVVLSTPEKDSSAQVLSENDDSLPFELVADRGQDPEAENTPLPSEPSEHSAPIETAAVHSEKVDPSESTVVASEMYEEPAPSLGVDELARELLAVELNLQSAAQDSTPTTEMQGIVFDSVSTATATSPDTPTVYESLLDTNLPISDTVLPSALTDEEEALAAQLDYEEQPTETPANDVIQVEIPVFDDLDSDMITQQNSSTETSTALVETTDTVPVETKSDVPVEEKATCRENLAFVPLERSGDVDGVELAFGDTFLALRGEFNSADLDPSAFLQLDRVEQEQVELLFSLASDELDGINPDAAVVEVSCSDEKSVDNAGLQQELNKVEQFIDEADAPTSLKDFFSRQSGKKGRNTSGDPSIQAAPTWRRLVATSIDMALVLIFCSAFASLFNETEGPAAIVADLSVNGFQARHTFIMIAGLSVLPLFATFYYALCFSMLGASLAARILSLLLTTEAGRPLKFRHVLVRSLSMPLAFVLGGYLPVLFGRRALPDVLARTRVVLDIE